MHPTLRPAVDPPAEPASVRLHDAATDLTELYQQRLAALTDSLPGQQA